MTTFNTLSFDIFTRILEYNTSQDISCLSLGCKQNSVDVKRIGEMTVSKRIIEKTNFLKTLGLYIDKYNNGSEQYQFDIPSIKEHLKSANLNDKSLVANGTNDFCVDGKMITKTSEKSLHIENLIQTVIEFLPERAYYLIETMTYSDYKNTEIMLDGMILYNSDIEDISNNNMVYILINNENIDTRNKSQIIQNHKKPVTIILSPLVTRIEDWAFDYCYYISSIIIPNSVTSIGDHAFGSCHALSSVIIPDSVTSIGSGAFENCTSLTSVIIPNSVTSLCGYTFCGCYGLTSVVIPDSVTSIGGYAFCWCERLTSIVIPHSVTSIGDYAFRRETTIIRR